MKTRVHPFLEKLASSSSLDSGFSPSPQSQSPPYPFTSPTCDTPSGSEDGHDTAAAFAFTDTNEPAMSTAVPEAADKRFTVEPMSAADQPEVVLFLREFFFKDEPLNRSLVLGVCNELEQWAVNYLLEGRSFKATNTQGEIIGVIINGLTTKNVKEECPEEVIQMSNSGFHAILNLMEYIGTQFDLFERYPQFELALEGKIMSVNEAYRGAGICKELTRRTIESMRAEGVHLFHVMCTSHFSSKVCERMGMEEVYTLPFRDYLVDGEQVLKPAEPHTASRLFAKIV